MKKKEMLLFLGIFIFTFVFLATSLLRSPEEKLPVRISPGKRLPVRISPEKGHKKLILDIDFNEGAGDKVFDKSQGLIGHVNNPKWVKGRSGSALEFNRNSYVRIPDSDSLKMDKFEIEVWIKLISDVSTWPGSYQTMLSKECDYILRFWNGHDEKGNGRGISGIYFGGGINHADAYLPGFKYTGVSYSGHETSNFSLGINRWYRINLKYDGNQFTLNINGKVVSRTFSKSKPTHSDIDLYIGSHINGIDGFIGIIDDVKIWSID